MRSTAARLLSSRTAWVPTTCISKSTQKRQFHQTPLPALGILDDAKRFVSRLTLRAEASHILVKGTDAQSEDRIQQIHKLLGSKKDNKNKNESMTQRFAEAAARVSDCPSGKQQGGSLGSFGRYSMVPEFDEIIFAPESRLGVVYGPFQTKFGYHLVLIHKRSDLE